jgi:hypothetical protein
MPDAKPGTALVVYNPGRGRPTKFNEDMAREICHRAADGETLRQICKDKKFPHRTTVQDWLSDNEQFGRRYAIAKACLIEDVADEILGIIDEKADLYEPVGGNDNGDAAPFMVRVNGAVVQDKMNRCDQRWKWLAKMLPQKYGDGSMAAAVAYQAPRNGDDAKEINERPVVIEQDPCYHALRALVRDK